MNSVLHVDPNRRVDPLFGDSKQIKHESIQRVVAIALPFLSLHSRGQILVSIGMGGCQIWTHLSAAKTHCAGQAWRAMGVSLIRVTVAVSCLGLTILFPLVQFVVSNGYLLISRSGSLVLHLSKKQWRGASENVLALVHCAIHVASVWYGGAGWMTLSLLTQAGLELYQSYGEYAGRGRWPEAMANAALAAIRIYKAKPHLQTLHRNYFGKPLTEDDWSKIQWAMDQSPEEIPDVESHLIREGFSSHIHALKIERMNRPCILKNLFFSNCDFSNSTLQSVKFSKNTFDSCLFENSKWIHSVVQDCVFRRSNFNNAALLSSLFERVSIYDSQLNRSCWNDSVLQEVSFIRSVLFETSFLNAEVSRSILKNSDLTDCLLLDAKSGFTIEGGKPAVITRPIVALAWHFPEQGQYTCYIEKALQDQRAIPLRFEMYPEGVHRDKLQIEIEGAIAEIRGRPSDSMLSIPSEILKRASMHSEIGKFKTSADSVIRHCDGLSLPGGQDIEAELYGAKTENQWASYKDYRRSLTEIAMLAAADKAGTPTMGTCRGSQMINVYFGGTLHQDIDGHDLGLQEARLTESSRKAWLQSQFGESFISYSLHHQAANRIGKDLEVVLESESIPKLLISKNGQFIASQIHPESYWALQQMSLQIDNDGQRTKVIEQNRKLYQLFTDCVHRFWMTRQCV